MVEHLFENSTSISSVDHDESCNVLSVTFKSGKTYQYKDVPKDVFETFKSCKSAGKHFQTHIKPKYDMC